MAKYALHRPAGAVLLLAAMQLPAFNAAAQTPPPAPQAVPIPAPSQGVAVPEVVVEQTKPVAAPVSAVKPKRIIKEEAPKAASSTPRPAIAQPAAAEALPPATAGLAPIAHSQTGGSSPALAPDAASPVSAAPISGQTVSTATPEAAGNRPVFRAGDLLSDVPGVSVKQGNGPRDIGVSIRGSNARNGFGVRNIVVYEDGFAVTQPDGLSRTDITDPHAYAGADVFRGPSSALFGNYATGGAINFRTRPGGDINGVESGIDTGSFGYLNTYLTGGTKAGNAEFAIFASDVRGDGYMGNADYNTQTINALLTFKPTGQDTVTLKVIDNQIETHLPIRQNLNQFRLNPYQQGCAANATKAAGCPTMTVAGGTLTAEQAGLGRDDRRTVLGARWEHTFDPLTVWRTQLVFDDRNINQPTGTTSAIGDYASWNLTTDVTKRTELFGLEATHTAGVYYNFLPADGDTFAVVAGGNAKLGRRTQNQNGVTSNLGFRLHEELKLDPRWTFAAGLAVEQTHIDGINLAFNATTGALTSKVRAARDFSNAAPEASLTFRADESLQVRGRVSTGYGTPQIGNLFALQDGSAGNNTQLRPQTNVGYDLGAVWAPGRAYRLEVTGFYEFFEDELVSQSPTPNRTFTFNAPASQHRGVEVAAKLKPVHGVTVTAAYLHNDQIYTQYTEKIAGVAFDRAGHKIPGVAPNELTARLAYDEDSGPFRGFGVFAEYQWRDAFYMDNGNRLTAGPAETVNVNVHYNAQFVSGFVREMNTYFEVRNILDRTNIASANNVTNTLTAGVESGASVLANGSGSIYAAESRAFYGGVKLKF